MQCSNITSVKLTLNETLLLLNWIVEQRYTYFGCNMGKYITSVLSGQPSKTLTGFNLRPLNHTKCKSMLLGQPHQWAGISFCFKWIEDGSKLFQGWIFQHFLSPYRKDLNVYLEKKVVRILELADRKGYSFHIFQAKREGVEFSESLTIGKATGTASQNNPCAWVFQSER